MFAFAKIDLPVARFVFPLFRPLGDVADGLGSAALLTLESAIVLLVVAIRLWRGHVSPFGKVLAVACLCSICAYAVNSSVVKIFFGVPNPWQVLQGARHAFHFWNGTADSSFPSGHMVLAGAFAGTFMRLYRTSVLPLSALLLVAAVLLILGDWHFVSDVIAGAFVGISAGILAGEVWLAHEKLASIPS
jgi:membrane-associated phospholipid phosphatase